MSDPVSSFQELQLAAVLINVLLEFLRGTSLLVYLDQVVKCSFEAERPSPDISTTYFVDGKRLANRLLRILSVALDTKEDVAFVQDAYAVILEASLHSRVVWDALVDSADAVVLHQILLLDDARKPVREHIARKIISVCGGDLPSTCPITKGEIASRYWSIVSTILPQVIRKPEQSQHLFGVAEHVFRIHDEYERDESTLRTHLVDWSRILLEHDHKAFVGREDVDYVVLGFTKLLQGCILSIKSFKKQIQAGAIMAQIFKKYIFVNRYVILLLVSLSYASRDKPIYLPSTGVYSMSTDASQCLLHQ